MGKKCSILNRMSLILTCLKRPTRSPNLSSQSCQRSSSTRTLLAIMHVAHSPRKVPQAMESMKLKPTLVQATHTQVEVREVASSKIKQLRLIKTARSLEDKTACQSALSRTFDCLIRIQRVPWSSSQPNHMRRFRTIWRSRAIAVAQQCSLTTCL